MVTSCLLVCEGNSDIPLVFHIQRLFETYGYPRPEFSACSEGRFLSNKILNGLNTMPQSDLVFVHRDADRSGAAARYQEIDEAMHTAEYRGRWVGIVPVRTTESWLLLDEEAIRNAVGNSSGRMNLDLPGPAETERIADPKSALRTAMLVAGDVQGRRRRMLDQRLPGARDRLLENLPVGGPLEQVPSWVKFRDDAVAALQGLVG